MWRGQFWPWTIHGLASRRLARKTGNTDRTPGRWVPGTPGAQANRQTARRSQPMKESTHTWSAAAWVCSARRLQTWAGFIFFIIINLVYIVDWTSGRRLLREATKTPMTTLKELKASAAEMDGLCIQLLPTFFTSQSFMGAWQREGHCWIKLIRYQLELTQRHMGDAKANRKDQAWCDAWWTLNTAHHRKHTFPTVKHGGSSIVLWGCFKTGTRWMIWSGRVKLQTSVRYRIGGWTWKGLFTLSIHPSGNFYSISSVKLQSMRSMRCSWQQLQW